MIATLALALARTVVRRAASAPEDFHLIQSNGSVYDLLFHQTHMSFQILSEPRPAFSINLIQFIIVFLISLAANGLTERLTGRKVGLWLAVIVTLFGTWLFVTYVNMPFDFALEGVPIISAILGATVVAVFYTLTLGKKSGEKK